MGLEASNWNITISGLPGGWGGRGGEAALTAAVVRQQVFAFFFFFLNWNGFEGVDLRKNK